MSILTQKQLADDIALELNAFTNKTFEVKLHDGINLSTEQANNADGISRFVIPNAITVNRIGAKTVQIDRTYLILYVGTTASDTAVIALQNEIENAMKVFIENGGPTKTIGWPCITAQTIAGAEAGYSLNELAEGKVAAGIELLFTCVE